MELRIGDEDENVAESGVLKQWSVTRLIPINQYGTFDIYYKYPDEDEWSIWEDADTYDLYSVPITKGSILTIVLHNDGSISDMDCFFPNNLKAKVSFANLGKDMINHMEVGTGYHLGRVAYTDSLTDYTVTDFVGVQEGHYGFFWEDTEVLAIGKYYYFPDSAGNPATTDVQPGKWYLFMVYDVEGKPYSNIFDVSPITN